ncbi:MAG: GH92 family glycosyl hydrolase [Bacteroidota bacterium]|nr:GH92 family glycosyl hydrolase [Bacteroidota bacterium]
MKNKLVIAALAICTSLMSVYGKTDLFKNVDSYIGSGGHGHVFIGASVPFGAVQVGPNNIFKGWDWCSGYHYSDSIIIGFPQTHLNGTGCPDMGDILFMPYTGKIRIKRGEQNNISDGYASYFKHKNELVNPAYYSVLLDNGVKVELTAAAHTAFHKYTFPKSNEGHIIIDLLEGNGDVADSTYMRLVDANTIYGYRFSKGWSPRNKVFFVAKTNYPLASLDLFDNDKALSGKDAYGRIKGVASFKKTPSQILIKVAISSVSINNALNNLNAEIPHWNFNQVVSDAKVLWNNELSKIQIETPNNIRKQIFYSALYHAFITPSRYSDVNGDFRGHDDKVYTKVSHTNYSTLSLWDTYRALNPMFTIIQPDKVSDIVNSMLGIYDQQGRLPIWPLAGGETDCMPGYSSVQLIADAYLKGFTGFDANRALVACKKTATNPKQKGIPYLLEQGYIPCDKLHEATSVAMEYAVADWGIAQMAKRMGRQSDYEYYNNRSLGFRHYFDSSIGFVRPKMADGSWRTPYDPIRSVHGVGDFTEGNGWQYTFFAPQNPEELIKLFGSDSKFVSKLDSFFVVSGDMGAEASSDITGLIGQYAHGNEPSHHIAYLYAFAGQQWKTAEKVRFITNKFYSNHPDGLIGNEDCGQMSAWYILSSMGIYQVNPTNGLFVFGSPLFDKVSIRLPQEKTFHIEAIDNSDKNIYIQRVELNGKPYTKSYILYKDIMAGGSLKFFMGPEPNYDFGKSPSDRPVSQVL